MKKYIAILSTAALIALSGCSSSQTSGASGASDAQIVTGGSAEPAPESPANPADSVPATAQTEIAVVTGESPEESRNEPPQLQVMYSGDGLATCAVMTISTYTWDTPEGIICADSIGPVASAAGGFINASVDLDTVSEGEPKINLFGGAKITNVRLFPLDGSDPIDLEFTADGVISFPESITEGVVCVYTEFPEVSENSAEYYFTVKRTLTNPAAPPDLRIFTGDIGFVMTKGGYEWTVKNGDEAKTSIADVSAPWESYENGNIKPNLSAQPGDIFSVMLPDGAEITAAEYWTASDSSHPLEYSGRQITLPNEELFAVCHITVTMPSGICSYLFTVQTEESASTPAFEPQSVSAEVAE